MSNLRNNITNLMLWALKTNQHLQVLIFCNHFSYVLIQNLARWVNSMSNHSFPLTDPTVAFNTHSIYDERRKWCQLISDSLIFSNEQHIQFCSNSGTHGRVLVAKLYWEPCSFILCEFTTLFCPGTLTIHLFNGKKIMCLASRPLFCFASFFPLPFFFSSLTAESVKI